MCGTESAHQCIDNIFRCDNLMNCPDGNDEEGCRNKTNNSTDNEVEGPSYNTCKLVMTMNKNDNYYTDKIN